MAGRQLYRTYAAVLLGVGLALSFVGAALAPAVIAQVPISVSLSDVDDSTDRVRALLTVDQAGRPVLGLTAGSVTVVDGGSQANVLGLEPAVDENIPLALILVIDTSGSMGPQLAEVQAAATGLIAQLGPADGAALISFASEVTTSVPLSVDTSALETSITALEPAGDTALYDAVAAASKMARDSGFARRAVVLLTDGEDFGGVSENERESSLVLADGAAAFYTIGVGSSVDIQYLIALGEQTGGRFFSTTTSDEIATVYATIEGLLRSQYVLEFERGVAVAGESRSLAISVNFEGGEVAGTAEYVSAAAAAPQPSSPQPTPATAATVAPPVAQALPVERDLLTEEEGSSVLRNTAILGAVALLVGIRLVFRRRRNSAAATPPTLPMFDKRPIARPVTAGPVRPSGWLTVAENDQALVAGIGNAPISVGTGAACDLALRRAPGVAPIHARVWTRDGRVMIHHLAQGFETKVNGRPIEWAVLSNEDQLTIGPYTIAFNAGIRPLAAAEVGGS